MRAYTAAGDAPRAADGARPLNARERELWRRFKRKAGRPKIGAGTTNVSVSMEKALLRRADRFARRHGMSRSQLISQGVRAAIGSFR